MSLKKRKDSEDLIICFSCLEVNAATAHFCKKCNTPLDSYSVTAPYEQTLAEGDSILKQTTPMTKRQLIGAWFFNGWIYPMFIFFIVCAVFNLGDRDAGWVVFFLLPFVWYSTVILRKAHKHYRMNKNAIQDDK